MRSELYVRPLRSFDTGKAHMIQIFLSDWLSGVCRNDYTVEQVAGFGNWKITFDSDEDAVIVKLTDLPYEFVKYIDLH